MNPTQWDEFKKDPVKFLNAGKYGWSLGGANPPTAGYAPLGGGSKFEGVKDLPIQKVKNVADYYVTVSSSPKQLEANATANPKGQKVKALWVPWKDGKGLYTAIQEEPTAEFIFTARLNGCAVIVGGDARWPVMAHVNAPNPPAPVAVGPGVNQKQAEEQTRANQMNYYKDFYLETAKTFKERGIIKQEPVIVNFSPTLYMAHGGAFGFVFGLKREGSWKFYYTMTYKGAFYSNEMWPRLTEPK